MPPRLLRETQGASTPEYAIFLVLILTVVVSIGSVAGNMFRDNMSLAALGSSDGAAAEVSEQTLAGGMDDAIADGKLSPWILVFAASQGVLAIAFAALFLRRRGHKEQGQIALRTDQILDAKLKSLLLMLRSKGATGRPWKPEVGHFMSDQAETVKLKTRFAETKTKLEASLHQAVYVVDKAGGLLGVITAVDLEPGCAPGKMMQEANVRFEKSTPLALALRQMIQAGVTIAPVTQNDQVCGTLSYMEAMLGLTASLQVIQENESKFQEKMMNMLGPTASTCQPNG